MNGSDRPVGFLFDNGSLRAAATLSLRRLATELGPRVNAPVRPVSLLHSSGVDPNELGGTPAELLEPALLEFGRAGGSTAILLPLFFGPSAALTEYLPARLAAIQRQCPALRVQLAAPLVLPDDGSERVVAEILAQAVRSVIHARGLSQPRVVLTDHGSPQRGVTAVRDRLGRVLEDGLRADIAGLQVASMERRPGPEYDFNDPLLAKALRTPPTNVGDVVVALQFLQSGRHAGPAGDIATICAEAERDCPGLRTYLTEPLVGDPRLVELLAVRYQAALDSFASLDAR